MYASLLGISRALHLSVFQNPADGQKDCGKLLVSEWKLSECFHSLRLEHLSACGGSKLSFWRSPDGCSPKGDISKGFRRTLQRADL
jgi:hypothetical protein